MGVSFFSGFWSKDLVLESALVSGQYLSYILGVITTDLTAFISLLTHLITQLRYLY